MATIQNKRRRNTLLLISSVCCIVFWTKLSKGQQLKLKGSSQVATLGEEFTWTCQGFVPPAETSASVFFIRNNRSAGLVAFIGSECYVFGKDPRYIQECLSDSTFTLTIPAKNMTEHEQNSVWRCENTDNALYHSPDVILNIESLGPPYVPPPLFRYQAVVEKTNLSVICGVTSGNSSDVSWTKSNDPFFKQDGNTLELRSILRNSSGSYHCTAENYYSNGDKERVWQYIDVDVLYSPTVSTLNNQTIVEGEDLWVTCNVTAGNPRSFSVFWTKADDPDFRQNRTKLQFKTIQRQSSGTYRCTAENYYNSLGRGRSSQEMVVNVLYPPSVYTPAQQTIVEGEDFSVSCNVIAGNFSSFNVFWTKVDNPFYRKDGATLKISNIHRSSSGIYICKADIYYNNNETVTVNRSMPVDVQYAPSVSILKNQTIFEGRDLSVTCNVTTGNPNSFTVFWSKEDDPNFRQNTITLTLSRIQRNSSGTYKCTAENYLNNHGKGKSSQIMVIKILYPPSVQKLDQQTIVEGENLSVTCNVTSGNPSSFNVFWTKLDNPFYREDGATLKLPYIQRNSSGIYTCRAENYYNNSYIGVANQSMVVNVLYPPTVEENLCFVVNESQRITLTSTISSNPLSNVYWYNGAKLLRVQMSVKTATFMIEKALCTDTKNFTLVASNGMQNNATSTVELLVNCKPSCVDGNITLGITDQVGIEFSTTVIAYPEPQYELKYMNGTTNNEMTGFILRNAVNNFTIYYSKTTIQQRDYGIYVLEILNSYGKSAIFIDVRPRQKPGKPMAIEALCDVTRAKVQWISSFDGGNKQTFIVTAINGGYESFTGPIPDRGLNKIHETYIENLEQSELYVIHVSARNALGSTVSNSTSCRTSAAPIILERPSSEALSNETKVAIGSVGGALVLSIIVVLVLFVFSRYKCSFMIKFGRRNKGVHEQTTEEENENHYEELTDITRTHTYQSLEGYTVRNPQKLANEKGGNQSQIAFRDGKTADIYVNTSLQK